MEIYRVFVQSGAPLACSCIEEETRMEVKRSLEGKALSAAVFNNAQEEALAYIRGKTWSELKKLWIILIQLWRKSFTQPGISNMDARVKVMRNYMPKPFMRFFGSPAMCLYREYNDESILPSIRTKGEEGKESFSIPRTASYDSKQKRKYDQGQTGSIDERLLFKEGFLKKKFLTRQGWATRYLRIILEKNPDDNEALPRVLLCYYDTTDDEDATLEPALRMEIDEHFTIIKDVDDARVFTIQSSSYLKENHTVNAMVELTSNGLTLRTETPGHRFTT